MAMGAGATQSVKSDTLKKQMSVKGSDSGWIYF